jgi:hypothetical protein
MGVVAVERQFGQPRLIRMLTKETKNAYKKGRFARSARRGRRYVLKGRVRVRYADRDEIFSAGDVYYMEPGHTMLVEEDYEAVEFSPRDEWNKTKEVIMRNLAATQ